MEPWEQLASEENREFAMFEAYLSVAPAYRTLKRAFEASNPGKLGYNEMLRERTAKRQRWEERAAAYDAHMVAIEREATELALAERGRRNAEKYDSWMSRLERGADMMMTRVEEAMQLPVVRQEVFDDFYVDTGNGEKIPIRTIIVNPAKWAPRDSVAAMKVISELVSQFTDRHQAETKEAIESGLKEQLNVILDAVRTTLPDKEYRKVLLALEARGK